jgi:hypothetical protein
VKALSQLGQIASQVWGAQHGSLTVPEMQPLPEKVQCISGATIVSAALDSFPYGIIVQGLPSNILPSQGSEIVQPIEALASTFWNVAAKKSIITTELGKNFVLTPLYFVVIDHIDVDGNTLRFMEPITAKVTYRDNMYYCQNEDLGITSMSTRWEGCVKDFQDEILFIWNEYGKEDEGRLTDDAKELKRRILTHIKK